MHIPRNYVSETQLADLLIERLNVLIANEDVRKDIETLIAARVPCSQATLDHPTIQAGWPTVAQDTGAPPVFGFLGLLNGIVGALPDGPRVGWGYITAYFDAEDGVHVLKRFQRTEPPTPAAARQQQMGEEDAHLFHVLDNIAKDGFEQGPCTHEHAGFIGATVAKWCDCGALRLNDNDPWRLPTTGDRANVCTNMDDNYRKCHLPKDHSSPHQDVFGNTWP